MNWPLTVVILALLGSTLTGAVMSIYAWRKRLMPGMQAFALMSAGLAWWSLTYGLEIILPGLAAKMWMARFEYIGIVTVPYGWVMFALAYSGRDRWVTRTRAVLLAVIPALTVLAISTNEFHHLFYISYELNNNGPLSVLDASYGPAWYVNFAYAYGMLLAGTVILFIRIFTIPNSFWFQQILLILSPVFPWVANLLYVLRISPIPQLDLSPIAFSLSIFILGMDIFHFRLFDITPLARSVVVDNMNISMLVVDYKGRLVDVNPAACRLINITASEALGQPVLKVLDRWPDLLARFARVTDANEEISAVVDGAQYYFRVQISTIYTGTRQPYGRLVMLTDITTAKLAEQALAMAQVRTEFLAKLSHELRTPLNAVLGVAEMLEYGVYDQVTPKQHKALSQIVERTAHLTRLIEDLLQFAQVESKYFSLQEAAFSPSVILQRVESTLGEIARRKGLRLTTELSPDMPPSILGDSTRLVQIALNLVENAVKFTLEGGVRVRIMRSGEAAWAMQVSDTGIGIPLEYHDHIFDAFKQANFTVTRTHPGVGLGLAIVKQLVDAMNGTVTVKSSERGTIFLVTLPLVLAGNDPKPNRAKTSPCKAS
jgi:PAS domain S-box-containing protein